jgi:hypothetical protein
MKAVHPGFENVESSVEVTGDGQSDEDEEMSDEDGQMSDGEFETFSFVESVAVHAALERIEPHQPDMHVIMQR